MNFSLNLITLASEADALLHMAARDKRNLLHRKETLDIRSENSAESVSGRAADLATAKAELASTIALLATLPDGPIKEDQEIKKMELELKIKKLSKSGNKADPVTFLATEYDADLHNRQIAGIDAFSAAVTERKAAL
jgi:hypothetical protein